VKNKLALALLFAGTAHAATLDVTCTPPTEREDGTALTAEDISHFNVYLNGELHDRTGGNICAYTGTIGGGNHELYMTTVDSFGLESVPSAAVTFKAPHDSKPKPPTLLQIISEWFANLWRLITGKPQVSLS